MSTVEIPAFLTKESKPGRRPFTQSRQGVDRPIRLSRAYLVMAGILTISTLFGCASPAARTAIAKIPTEISTKAPTTESAPTPIPTPYRLEFPGVQKSDATQEPAKPSPIATRESTATKAPATATAIPPIKTPVSLAPTIPPMETPQPSPTDTETPKPTADTKPSIPASEIPAQLDSLIAYVKAMPQSFDPTRTQEAFAMDKRNFEIPAQEAKDALEKGNIEVARKRLAEVKAAIGGLGDPMKDKFIPQEIRRGTLKAIIDDLDMTVEEFIQALKD